MSYLIEKDGERQFVDSLDGYDGWDVVSETEEQPKDFHDFIDGQWVLNEEKKLEAQQRDFARMSREELVAWIEILEARLDTLEDTLNG